MPSTDPDLSAPSIASTSVAGGHVDPPKVETPPELRVSRLAQLALVLALLPILTWGACVVDVIDANGDAVVVLWLMASILATLGAVIGLINVSRLKKAPTDARPKGRALSIVAAVLGFLSPFISFLLGLATFPGGFTRGRRLVRLGKLRQVIHVPRADWTSALDDTDLRHAPAVAAEAWRVNAATEHASVASFAHLSNQLLAVGAPARLVRAAHEDALDEIRHAELCYALAARIDGEPRGPDAFPWAARAPDRAPSVPVLAAEALVEACLLEGASARLLVRLASTEGIDPSVRAILKEIATDEGRHAAHGWDIVSWALDIAPAATASALVDTLAQQPPLMNHDLDERWASGQLLAWGIPSTSLWADCYADAWRAMEARLERLLAARDSGQRRAA